MLFDPKYHELPARASDIDEYRLPEDELEELGLKVIRLRENVQARVAAIKAVGDGVSTARARPAQVVDNRDVAQLQAHWR